MPGWSSAKRRYASVSWTARVTSTEEVMPSELSVAAPTSVKSPVSSSKSTSTRAKGTLRSYPVGTSASSSSSVGRPKRARRSASERKRAVTFSRMRPNVSAASRRMPSSALERTLGVSAQVGVPSRFATGWAEAR